MANENNGKIKSETPITDRLFNLAQSPGEKDNWESAFKTLGEEIQSGMLEHINPYSEPESEADSKNTDDE